MEKIYIYKRDFKPMTGIAPIVGGTWTAKELKQKGINTDYKYYEVDFNKGTLRKVDIQLVISVL